MMALMTPHMPVHLTPFSWSAQDNLWGKNAKTNSETQVIFMTKN